MKRVRIHTSEIGMVLKNGEFRRLIEAGTHWLRLGEKAMRYERDTAFKPGRDLNWFLRHEAIRNALHLVEVKENEIALRFEDGLFKEVLSGGKYAYWRGAVSFTTMVFNLDEMEVPAEVPRYLFGRAAMWPYVRVFKVEAHEKGVMLVRGKTTAVLESGEYFYWKNSTPVQVLTADMRQMPLELNGQELLTKDKAALRLTYYAQYRVVNVEKALVESGNYQKQLYTVLQLALRAYVGTLTLDELLARKDEVATYVEKEVRAELQNMGIKLSYSGIRDVILPGDMKDIMNQVLVAQKRAQAQAISRREETAATRSMLNTARLMDENPMLWKLKEMEYTEKIAEKINSISLSGGNVSDQLRELFSR